jgi:hypothetical protein
MRSRLAYYYRGYRQHQLATYGNSGLHVNGVDQRQFVGGGAAYGWHAVAAFTSAKHQVYLARLREQELRDLLRRRRRRRR